jgi:hypothetical protein
MRIVGDPAKRSSVASACVWTPPRAQERDVDQVLEVAHVHRQQRELLALTRHRDSATPLAPAQDDLRS